jgi:hypothetical protein
MEQEKENSLPQSKRVFAGLVFPQSGYPLFYCIVSEKKTESKGFEEAEPEIEIIKEGEAKTLTELYKELKTFKDLKCSTIYIQPEKKYANYVRDINKWKRKENIDLRFKATTCLSFESGILKIKEFVQEKRLGFQKESTIRGQLAIFSRLSLEKEDEFYAVKSLCLVINSFNRRNQKTEEELDKSSWW